MLLLISGEGPTDMGRMDGTAFQAGPMACLADQWVQERTGYSLLEAEHVALINETQLSVHAKKIKPLSRRGKKTRHCRA